MLRLGDIYVHIRTKNETVILLVISGGEMKEDDDEIEEDVQLN